MMRQYVSRAALLICAIAALTAPASARPDTQNNPRSLQLHDSGASDSAIRDAIEKKYAGATLHTPTPMPKRGGGHD